MNGKAALADEGESQVIEAEAVPQEPLPLWLQEIITLFAVTHGFILVGDVWGVSIQNVPQRRFLQTILAGSRKVVASYNRARGITFALPSQQEEAERLLMEPEDLPLDADPASDVLDEAGVGVQPTGDRFRAARSPKEALPLLEKLLRAPEGYGQVAVLLDFADLLCPPQNKSTMSDDDRLLLTTLLSWGQDEELSECNNPIFLLARDVNDLHVDLRSSGSGYQVVEIPQPSLEERLKFITWYLGKREEQEKPIALVDLSPQELANLTAGLNFRNIENILLLGARNRGVTRALVGDCKRRIIKAEYSDIAEILEPLPGGFASIGGVERLEEWARWELLEPISAGSRDFPHNILLVGPPGTGKTTLVRALAYELGFNCVALRAENILGGVVGESERQLKRFFAFARSLAPVLIFFDELDQSGMSRRGNSSGNPVDVNLFSQLLQFSGGEVRQSDVVMCYASNRPDLIDDALLRRMDVILPVLLADEPGRRGIITRQATEQGIQIEEAVIAFLAAQTSQYSADDLRLVLYKARNVARRAGRWGGVLAEDIKRAFWAINVATPRIANRYIKASLRVCKDRELLPPPYDRMKFDDDDDARSPVLGRSGPRGTRDERRL